SFLYLMQRDPGFRTDHLLTFSVGLPGSEYSGPRLVVFSRKLIEQLHAIPGVERVAFGRPLPLEGHEMRAAFQIDGRIVAATDRPRSDMAIVSPGFFGTMGIPLIRGRDFTERDSAEAPAVVVVNQAFASKFFPGEDVIGKRIQPGVGSGSTMREIVGL